jgi:hypothetical protein
MPALIRKEVGGHETANLKSPLLRDLDCGDINARLEAADHFP